MKKILGRAIIINDQLRCLAAPSRGGLAYSLVSFHCTAHSNRSCAIPLLRHYSSGSGGSVASAPGAGPRRDTVPSGQSSQQAQLLSPVVTSLCKQWHFTVIQTLDEPQCEAVRAELRSLEMFVAEEKKRCPNGRLTKQYHRHVSRLMLSRLRYHAIRRDASDLGPIVTWATANSDYLSDEDAALLLHDLMCCAPPTDAGGDKLLAALMKQLIGRFEGSERLHHLTRLAVLFRMAVCQLPLSQRQCTLFTYDMRDAKFVVEMNSLKEGLAAAVVTMTAVMLKFVIDCDGALIKSLADALRQRAWSPIIIREDSLRLVLSACRILRAAPARVFFFTPALLQRLTDENKDIELTTILLWRGLLPEQKELLKKALDGYQPTTLSCLAATILAFGPEHKLMPLLLDLMKSQQEPISKTECALLMRALLPTQYAQEALTLCSSAIPDLIESGSTSHILQTQSLLARYLCDSASPSISQASPATCNDQEEPSLNHLCVGWVHKLVEANCSKVINKDLSPTDHVQIGYSLVYLIDISRKTGLLERNPTLISQIRTASNKIAAVIIQKPSRSLVASRRGALLRLMLDDSVRESLIQSLVAAISGPISFCHIAKEVLPFLSTSRHPAIAKLINTLLSINFHEDTSAVCFCNGAEALSMSQRLQHIAKLYGERATEKDVEQHVMTRMVRPIFDFFACCEDKDEVFLPADIVDTTMDPIATFHLFAITYRPVPTWVREEILTLALQSKAQLPMKPCKTLIRSVTSRLACSEMDDGGKNAAMINLLKEFPEDVPKKLTGHFVAGIKLKVLTSADLSPNFIKMMIDATLPQGYPLLLLALESIHVNASQLLSTVIESPPAVRGLMLRVWAAAPQRAAAAPPTDEIASFLLSIAKRCDVAVSRQVLSQQQCITHLPYDVVRSLWDQAEVSDSVSESEVTNALLVAITTKIPDLVPSVIALLDTRGASYSSLILSLATRVPLALVRKAIDQARATKGDDSFTYLSSLVRYIVRYYFFQKELISDEAIICFKDCLSALASYQKVLPGESEGMLLTCSKAYQLLLRNEEFARRGLLEESDPREKQRIIHYVDSLARAITEGINPILDRFIKCDATSPSALDRSLMLVPPALRPLLTDFKLKEIARGAMEDSEDFAFVLSMQQVLEKHGALILPLQETIIEFIIAQLDKATDAGLRVATGSPVDNALTLLKHSLRSGSFEPSSITLLTEALLEIDVEGPRVEFLMKLLHCFAESPVCVPQHELVVKALLDSEALSLTADDFAKLVNIMSRMQTLASYTGPIGALLENLYGAADPRSQSVILRALSHDEGMIQANLELLIQGIEPNISVLDGPELENVAAALIQISGHVDYGDVGVVIERLCSRVLATIDTIRKSSLVRVLHLLINYRLQDEVVLNAIYTALEEKMPRLDINQLLLVLRSMVELEMMPREALILLVAKRIDQVIDTMSPSCVVQALSSFVDLNVAFLPATNNLFMRAIEQKDAIRQSQHLQELMEKVSEEYIIEAPQHATRHFLKKKQERIRMQVLRDHNMAVRLQQKAEAEEGSI